MFCESIDMDDEKIEIRELFYYCYLRDPFRVKFRVKVRKYSKNIYLGKIFLVWEERFL